MSFRRTVLGWEDCAEDDGYMLIFVIVLVFLVLLTLSIAAPRVAMQLKRDRELETQHRAQQYVRALRLYYKKFGHYPASVEQLEKTNNQRFLRQHYLDPLTGKDDWKLIAVGQNKTTVKGFFGQDLSGMGAGLGSAAGMQSGGQGSGTTGGSAFNNSPGVGANGNSLGATGSTPGGVGTTGTGTGTGAGDQSGINASGSTGPFMGIGVPATGEAFLTVNEKSSYEDWEFLYDPRIEQLYAKGAGQTGLSGGTGSGGQVPGAGGTFPNSGVNGNGGLNGTPTPVTPTPQQPQQ